MAYGISDVFATRVKPSSKSSFSKSQKQPATQTQTKKHFRPNVKSDELLFAVREPFKSIRTQTTIVAGKVNKQNLLTIESLMPTQGIIFSDGVEKDFISFNSGSIATIGLANESANIVLNKT
jgi:hypothetical protein